MDKNNKQKKICIVLTIIFFIGVIGFINFNVNLTIIFLILSLLFLVLGVYFELKIEKEIYDNLSEDDKKLRYIASSSNLPKKPSFNKKINITLYLYRALKIINDLSLLFIFTSIILSLVNGLDNEKITNLLIFNSICLILFLLTCLIINYFIYNKFKRKILKKYPEAKLNKKSGIRITDYIPFYQLYSSKKTILYSVKLEQYKCTVTNILLYERAINDSGFYHSGTMLKYEYDLDFNLKTSNQLNSIDVLKDELNELLNTFKDSRLIEMDIYQSKLVISKYLRMGFLFEDEIKENIDDIELFYKTLVKKINEFEIHNSRS